MHLSVRVVAGAKKEKVEMAGKRLNISVKEPAKQNLANRRVRQLVAAHLGLPVAKVRLISGHTSPAKIFSVEG